MHNSDLIQYRAQLQAKIDVIDQILSDLGQASAQTVMTNHKPAHATPAKRTMSPENRARLAAIARARWKKAKAAGKIRL